METILAMTSRMSQSIRCSFSGDLHRIESTENGATSEMWNFDEQQWMLRHYFMQNLTLAE